MAARAAAPDLGQFLAACASGRELRERGFGQDVELAAQLDISATVPYSATKHSRRGHRKSVFR